MDYAKSVEQLAKRYNQAEQEVVAAYFDQVRTPAEHVHWLKAQAFKEYSAIKPLVKALEKLYPQLDRQVDRHDYEELCEKLADETKHARLIMDFLEELTGRRLTQQDLTWLPEDQKLARVRARYSKSYAGLLHGSERITSSEIQRRDEALERAAITLTEGGGGALYEVCRKLTGGTILRRIASIFKAIHRDEVKHKDSGGKALENLIKTTKDYDRTARIIRAVSSQRLRMRNEQFGYPLEASTLRELDLNSQRHKASGRGPKETSLP
jgi:hypothetical protein